MGPSSVARVLLRARAERRRLEAIDAEVPQFLDVLAAASSARLAAPLALRRGDRSRAGPLADELRSALEAVDLGARWRDEFWALGCRLELLALALLPVACGPVSGDNGSVKPLLLDWVRVLRVCMGLSACGFMGTGLRRLP